MLRLHLQNFAYKLPIEWLEDPIDYANFKKEDYDPVFEKLSPGIGHSSTRLLLLGWLYAEKQDYKAAMERVQEAIGIFNMYKSDDPSKLSDVEKKEISGLYALRAELCLQQKKYDLALKFADAAIKVALTNEAALVVLAQARLGKVDAIISKNPDTAKKELDLAKDDCEKAIKLNANYEPAYIALSQIYLLAKQNEAVIDTARKFLKDKLNDKNAFIYSILSEAHTRLGNYADAFETAQTALNIMQDKNLSKTNKVFAKLETNDIKQLKARCALANALKNLEDYKKTLESDFENKKLPSKDKKKLEEKIAALAKLEKNLQGPLRNLLIDANNTSFFDILRSQDKELNKHRGPGKIFKNIALAAGTLGVGYVFAGLIHLAATHGKHFAFFNDTKTMKKIKEVEKQAHVIHKPK